MNITQLTLTNTTNFVNFAQSYAYSLPNLILQGDLLAIIMGSIVFLVALFLVNKITSLILTFIKKTIFLFITGLAVYYLTTEVYARVLISGFTAETIIFSLVGLLVGIFGIFLSFRSWFSGAKESIQKIKHGPEITQKYVKEESPEKESILTELKGLKNEFSLQMIKQDKNLLSVLVYLIIGQFGIFSSPTVAPPNPQLGLVFFGLFLLGALFFVRQTYKNFKTGFLHLIVALTFGIVLSLVLGYFWAGIPISTLISLQYFGTSCVIAVITGMAVSLIMGGK